MYPGSTSHVTYSLVDPHGTWVTLISHARVPDVNEVSKAKARFTVSEDEVPMSTYTTMPDIIIKMLNSSIILNNVRLIIFALMFHILTMLSSVLTTNCGRSWCNTSLKQKQVVDLRKNYWSNQTLLVSLKIK